MKTSEFGGYMTCTSWGKSRDCYLYSDCSTLAVQCSSLSNYSNWGSGPTTCAIDLGDGITQPLSKMAQTTAAPLAVECSNGGIIWNNEGRKRRWRWADRDLLGRNNRRICCAGSVET